MKTRTLHESQKETTMNTITMTQAETAIWDGRNEAAQKRLMEDLSARAQVMADNKRTTVEVHTADGIMVDQWMQS